MRPVYQAIKFSEAMFSSSLILAVGVVIWLIFKPPISLFGELSWASVGFGLAGGLLGYLVIFIITKHFFMHLHSMRELMHKLSSMFRGFSWPAILVISAMAGISEELLVRGLLQHYLIEFTNPAVGILLASLAFGLMHFLSKLYVLVTFAMGLAFGIAYHVSDSLVLVMTAHAAYDVLAFAVLVKYPHSLLARGQHN